MNKRPFSTTLLAFSLACAGLLTPLVAQARCPSIGDKGLSGDCSPRSTQCYKSWVTDHRWMNGSMHYQLLVYRRDAGGNWDLYSQRWIPC